MKNFETLFCEDHACQPRQFTQKFFWKTVPVYAVPFVFAMGGLNSRHFAAERTLIETLRQADDMNDVRWAINDFLGASAGRGWLRSLLGVEVSSWRVKFVARCYLPGAGSMSSSPFEVFEKLAR
jgi:hypothetical protein